MTQISDIAETLTAELMLMQEFDADVSKRLYLQGFKKGHRLNK